MISWIGCERSDFAATCSHFRKERCFSATSPLIRVVAPLPEAQFVESRLINLLHFQTMIASKAARCVLAAPGRTLVDFGFRRAHGGEAGIHAARACYLVGFAGTATVAAGALYDIPLYGTMAHSFVQAHDSEIEAFRLFSHTQPENVVLLIDTYDVVAGAGKVVGLASELKLHGIAIKAVRIDSGDLAENARVVRSLFDDAGLHDVGIFVSGNLDEHRLAALVSSDAPIDGYGIGTRLDTSADVPSLDAAYKLQEYRGLPRRKRSVGKATWPGRKQVFRNYDPDGTMSSDLIGLEYEDHPGHPVLRQYMENGRRLHPPTPMSDIREHTRQELRRLPEQLRSLDGSAEYPVRISDPIRELADAVDSASTP